LQIEANQLISIVLPELFCTKFICVRDAYIGLRR